MKNEFGRVRACWFLFVQSTSPDIRTRMYSVKSHESYAPSLDRSLGRQKMTLRIVFVCDWLPPDFGAIGQYTLIDARVAARSGNEVVLGGLSSSGDSVEHERHDEGTLVIERLAMPQCNKKRLLRRLLWTLRTNARLIFRLWPALRRADEIRFTGSPPFMLHFVWGANLILRKRLVYRIADFHPECLMAAMRRVPLGLRLFHRVTVSLRRSVDRIEAIGEDQRRRLLAQGIPPERVEVKRYRSPVTITRGTPAAPPPPELEGYSTLLYSGNWGVAHEYETFVEGYRLHHHEGSGRIALWLNATGQCADTVEHAVRKCKLPVARGRPVPLDQLASVMVAPDAHLITLRDEFVGYVVPSKVHACIDSGRPVFYVGSTESDVHLLCRASMATRQYYQSEVGDAQSVFGAFERLSEQLDSRSSRQSDADGVPVTLPTDTEG